MIDIKSARENMSMSQHQLAMLTGLSQQAISSIESKVRRPSVESAKRLASVLGISWTAFFDDDSEEPQSDYE